MSLRYNIWSPIFFEIGSSANDLEMYLSRPRNLVCMGIHTVHRYHIYVQGGHLCPDVTIPLDRGPYSYTPGWACWFSSRVNNQSPATNFYSGILTCRKSAFPKNSQRYTNMPNIRYWTKVVNPSFFNTAATSAHITGTSEFVPTTHTIRSCNHFSA